MINIKSFTFGPVEENTYVLYNENNDAAIVDCGVSNKNEEDKLALFIEENKLKVNMIINTHMHFDHAIGNTWAKSTFKGVKFYAPHKDLYELPSIKKQIERFMYVGDKDLDLSKSEYTNIKKNDILTLGNDKIRILEVPGHSPGHIALYIEDSNAVMSGDVLFYESIGRTDLWGGDYATLINSIKKELFTLPDDTVVYSGHGPKTTIQHEKENNPFLY